MLIRIDWNKIITFNLYLNYVCDYTRKRNEISFKKKHTILELRSTRPSSVVVCCTQRPLCTREIECPRWGCAKARTLVTHTLCRITCISLVFFLSRWPLLFFFLHEFKLTSVVAYSICLLFAFREWIWAWNSCDFERRMFKREEIRFAISCVKMWIWVGTFFLLLLHLTLSLLLIDIRFQLLHHIQFIYNKFISWVLHEKLFCTNLNYMEYDI